MIGKYPMNIRTVRGKLVASNHEAVIDLKSQYALQRVFKDNGLRRMIYMESRWDDDCISFDTTSELQANHEGALNFIKVLSDVLQSDEAAKFGFSGGFTVVTQTYEEPIVFRVKVNGQKVTYEEAAYSWS